MPSAKKPVNLTVLLQDIDFGGTQKYALNLIEHLDRNLFNPQLWLMRGGEDQIAQARAAGVEPIYLSRRPNVGPAAIARLYARLMKVRPQLLYTLTVVPNTWARLFGLFFKIPIVSGCRGSIPGQEKILWRVSRRIICNAEDQRRILIDRIKADPKRLAVIPNAVDTQRFKPQPLRKSKDPTIIFIGRLHDVKDPFGLLEAFKLVLKDLPRARLIMLGDGPLEEDLKIEISRSNIESRVTIHPGASDIRPFLDQARLMALASVREASPNVILEAMAAGLPVVATNVGGIPELVDEGKTGFLVPPGNPQALARAMAVILKDQNLQQDLSRNSRDRAVNQHSLPQMARKTEQVLLEALPEGSMDG